MKLVRFGDRGCERPGIIDDAGQLRDVSEVIADWRGDTITPESLARLENAILPPVESSPRLGVPLSGIGKIVGIGLNYRAHAAEAGLPPPADPIMFLKPASALNGPEDDIILPRGSTETDWEIELAVIIGKGGKYISKEDALSHVAGYCIANDVSEREYQIRRGTQWIKGKSADTFAPLGPWLVTADEVTDPQDFLLELFLNGERMQKGNSGDMIFSVAELISRISEYASWQPGDVMITGTPPGVGYGMKPQRFLRAGDLLTLRISGLGEQNTRIMSDNF